jgi:hypothetical protein
MNNTIQKPECLLTGQGAEYQIKNGMPLYVENGSKVMLLP